MNRLITFVFMFCGAVALLGCTPNTSKNLVGHCGNTFVVSDGNHIFLFEHEDDSTHFHLLKTFENSSNNAAFYDCQRNIIVSPYGYKGIKHNKGGVTIFDLNSGKAKDYDISDGVNGQTGLYKNGVLLSTMLIHLTPIDEKLGYVPPRAFIDKESVFATPDMFSEELVNDYKAGKYWKTFEYTHLFDLDTYKVTHSYKQSLYEADIFEGKVYSQLAPNSFGTMNLESGFREKIIERTTVTNKDGTHLTMPANALYLPVEGNYYILTTQNLWDSRNNKGEKGIRQFKKNTLYKVENEQLVELVTLPFDKVGYALTRGENIFTFSQDAKSVAKFDTQTKQLTQYNLSVPERAEGYYIESVGYTKNNFIFSLSRNDGYSDGLIFLTNKSFTDISPVYEVNMESMSTTTNESIRTSNHRSVR